MHERNLVTAREDNGLSAAQAELAGSIERWAESGNPPETVIPSFSLIRLDAPTEPATTMHEAGICLVAQGTKRVMLGLDVFTYSAQHFLITSVGLPVVTHVIEASRKKPYLGLTLKLDQREIAQLMVDSNLPSPRIKQASMGMAVGQVTLPLFKAFQRLIDLLDEPEDIPILAPLIQREILYRLLLGPQGLRLRQIATTGSPSQRIALVMEYLKRNFTRHIRIDELAARSGMSLSTFHFHFRHLTAMTPLQYQKMLRLHEARRLMLAEHLDAATASFQVGYGSPSQFNREYSRMFGSAPLRDIKRLHQLGILEKNQAEADSTDHPSDSG